MTTIGEAAKSYESKTTKNISELKEVNRSIDLKEGQFSKDDGEIVKYKFIVVDGEEYRVPASVLKQLKGLIEENKGLTRFKVKKTGEGLKTEYQVIALD